MADAPTFTDVQVMEALAAAVAEKGDDYVYPKKPHEQCQYVHDKGTTAESAGCIAGNVLHRLGIPLSTLAKHEGDGVYSLPVEDVFSASEAALSALGEAQDKQDEGKTWGEALGAAHATYAGITGNSLWPHERPHF